MGELYAATGTVNVAASPGKTNIGLTASTTTRGRLTFFTVGHSGTPVADNVIQWLVRRYTTDGTGTAGTPRPLDLAAPAARLTTQSNYSVEPTFSLTLMDLAVHQRAYYQWQALPGREILIPASAGNGVGFTPINGSFTGQSDSTVVWEE
jgi:hypothetical protein